VSGNPLAAAPAATRASGNAGRDRDAAQLPAGGSRDPALARRQRRKILEDELATEEKGLLDAKSKLTEQESVRHGDEKNYSASSIA